MPLAAQVEIRRFPDRISVDINGAPFTSLYIANVRKPYLHPLRSASGKIVTRRYPMENVEGEPKDHPHHRGLWFTHGDVNGVDFWMSDPLARNDNGAVIAVKQIHRAKGGRDKGQIVATFEWRDKSGAVHLVEDRTITFYAETDRRTMDIEARLTAANRDVKFGDTKEGSFGLRLNPQLQELKGTGKMTNAEGAQTEKQVWGRPSAWVDYAGTIDGEPLGIAILDHPSNPRHPTHWHSRAYGLFAANIFGLHDFYGDKTKDGSLLLKKGESLRFLYRVLIHPGDTASANIAAEFRKFAELR
ncbi:MAG: PmoA family protein [Bryobacteraceae bacterium]|nr:PmoA family protein [Bryobacteraceae bacterium]MDW8378926.1 PmoA family protein [Bryobacterales bacterium]